MEADLLLAELQSSLGLVPGELELPSVDGDPTESDVVLILLDAVLDPHLASTSGVLCR